MRGNDLLDKMELVAPAFVEAADVEPIRKKHRWVKWGVMAACLCLAFSLTIPAMAAFIPAFYEGLYAISPATAQFFKPIQLSCEDNGIRMGVEAVYIHESTAEIYISLQDLEGARLDETIDLFDSYNINTPFDSTGHCQFSSYDPETQTAIFLITIEQWNAQNIIGDKLTFSIREILSHKKTFDGIIAGVNLGDIELITTTQDVYPRGFSGGDFVDAYRGTTMTALKTIDSITSPTEGVVLRGVGFVDGSLHVQVYYDDILRTDDHGSIALISRENGKLTQCNGSFSFFDDTGEGSYEDYIFTGITDEALNEYELYGSFLTSSGSVEGDWSVTLELENTDGEHDGDTID